jgi:ABC-type transport system involved in multi-copper enzyme maturation permease subunit
MLGCSDAITSEVRSGTLGLMLMTPLTPLKIVLAKWSAVLFQTFTLLLSGAPALAVCAYLGGVGPVELLQSIGGCLLAAGFGAALAIHGSSTARSPARAFLSAFLRILLFYFLWVVAIQIGAFGLAFGRGGFPVMALLQYGGQGLVLLLTLALLGLAARNTRRRLAQPERWNALAHAYETKPSYYSKIDRDGKRLVIKGGVWESRPLLWKDLATRSGGRASGLRRGLLAVLIGLLVVFPTLGTSEHTTGFTYFTGFVLVLLAVVQGASLFAPENSGRRWDMLLTAPVSSSSIVGSKLAAGVVAPEAVVTTLLLLLPLGVHAFFVVESGAGFLLLLSTLLYLSFVYCLAAFCSLHSRTSRNAFMAAGLIVALLILLPLLGHADPLLAALNPAVLYEECVDQRHEWVPLRQYAVPAEAFPYFLFQWGFYGGASVLLALALCRRFRAVAASYA